MVPVRGPARRALDEADIVYTEIAMDAATQQSAMTRAVLPPGQQLGDLVPPTLYARLGGYLKRRGGSVEALANVKVWAVAAALGQLAYADRFARGEPPLDLHLAREAERLGKRTGALETLDDQVAAMESQGLAGERAMLRDTLDQLEEAEQAGRDPIEELMGAYLDGDTERLLRLAEEGTDPADAVSRALMRALIDDRNRGMAEAILSIRRERPDEVQLFAVGALHLPGESGVVTLLRRAGLTVERVAPE